MTASRPAVTGGVDTHKDAHHCAALDQAGRLMGERAFPATPAGYRQLLGWLGGFGAIEAVGVEGTGCYGAGLARHLAAAGVPTVEVARPDRSARRARGKSDPLDALSAARAVQAGTASARPKAGDGAVEAIRVLRAARRGAVKARTAALNELHAVVLTADPELRERLRALTATRLVARCAAMRPDLARLAEPATAARAALRSLARRIAALSAEVKQLDAALAPLVRSAAPSLLAINGVGTHVAATLLVTAGDNPARIRSEAAFARLCGVAPIPASSGRTDRHRLHRGGDRDANNALYTIVLGRLRHDPRTRAYAARRTTQGLGKKEIIRCLKRYAAREIHHALAADLALARTT